MEAASEKEDGACHVKRDKEESKTGTPSFTPSLLHSFTPSLLRSLTPSLPHSLLHSFTPSLLHSHHITIAGEFHFDNVSAVYQDSWTHNLLTRYEDPFAVRPGRDQPWSLTTNLNPAHIYDMGMKLPKNLLAFLTSADTRPTIVAPVPDESDDEDALYRHRHHHHRRSTARGSKLVNGGANGVTGADARNPPGSDGTFVPGTNRTARILLQHAIGLQLPCRVQQASFVTALPHVTTALPVIVRFTIGNRDPAAQQKQQQQATHTATGAAAVVVGVCLVGLYTFSNSRHLHAYACIHSYIHTHTHTHTHKHVYAFLFPTCRKAC